MKGINSDLDLLIPSLGETKYREHVPVKFPTLNSQPSISQNTSPILAKFMKKECVTTRQNYNVVH